MATALLIVVLVGASVWLLVNGNDQGRMLGLAGAMLAVWLGGSGMQAVPLGRPLPDATSHQSDSDQGRYPWSQPQVTKCGGVAQGRTQGVWS